MPICRGWLLEHWEVRLGKPRLADETDGQYGIRMFRETGGCEASWHLLAECTGLESDVLQTLALGTFYRPDEPSLPEPTRSECVESFLAVIEKHVPIIA